MLSTGLPFPLLFYNILNFIVQFSTPLLLHFILYTDSNHIFYRWMSRIVYRSSVFAIISLCAMSKVVCGSQMPLPFVFLVFVNYKAEILAMIVFVFGNIIEHHSTIHLFHILIILCEIARHCQKINIVKHGVAKRYNIQCKLILSLIGFFLVHVSLYLLQFFHCVILLLGEDMTDFGSIL